MNGTYYEVLGVPPDATADQIRIAYLSLARHYHPDVNRDPEANQRMAQINLAYETLSDPEKRLQYDAEIGLREPSTEETREAIEQDWSWLRCEKCGKRDATLRVSIAMLTMSLLIVSFRRGAGGGLLCSTCRAKDGLWYSLASLVLGPWGIPWGIFWTIQAIWTNMGGQIQPQRANAQILRLVAAALYSEGRYWEAADAVAAGLGLHDTPDQREALDQLKAAAERDGTRRVYTPRGLDPGLGRLGFFGGVSAAVVGVILAIGVVGRSEDNTTDLSFPVLDVPSGSGSARVSESECRTALNSLFIASEIEGTTTSAGALDLMGGARRSCRADPERALDAFCDARALNEAHIRWQIVWC